MTFGISRPALTVRAVKAALVLLTVAGVVAGCGSSSPSAASFRHDGNRICAEYGRKLDAVEAKPGDTARTLAKTIPLLERMNGRFQRLTPPSREKERFQQFLEAQRQSLREMRRIQRFIATNEPKALAALKREKPRLHVPPAQALEQPTAATLAEANSIPAVRSYLRGLDSLERAGAKTGRELDRLTTQLGFTACR
jgi:hypothetical protein